jgi:hypothetical protein
MVKGFLNVLSILQEEKYAYGISMVCVYVLLFQRLNQLNTFREIWRERYSTGDYSKNVYFNFLKSIITIMAHGLVR